MTTTVPLDELISPRGECPGAQLALIRETRGYTQDYVAGQLHLRVSLIAMLEADRYEKLPQSVFVKGYIRAYAKLLQVAPEPFIVSFNALQGEEKPLEKALWQNKRESKLTEGLVRWTSGVVVLLVVVAVSVWWQKKPTEVAMAGEQVASPKTHTLNAASTLHALFQTAAPKTEAEKNGV